jgi:hypothetical protein
LAPDVCIARKQQNKIVHNYSRLQFYARTETAHSRNARGLVAASPHATEETGAMGRYVAFFLKKRILHLKIYLLASECWRWIVLPFLPT